MSAPLAVDPSMMRPGIYVVVNFLRGASSPGAQGLRCAIISPPASTPGNQTVGTEIRQVFSAEEVETASGKSLAFYAYKSLFANDPRAVTDLVLCAASAGATATGTITFTGAPTSNMTFRFWGQGWSVDLPWNVGEANTVARDRAVTLINQLAADMSAIASAGSGGVVNITFRTVGPAGNDFRIRTSIITGAGATLPTSGATLTGGTTEVDMTTALSTLGVKEYDYILICASNADAQSSSGTANPGRLAAHIDANLTGSAAKLQQGVYGSTGTIALAKTNAIARNHTNLEHVLSRSDESLPCEVAAAELGDRMKRRRLESNANRVLQPLKRIKGAADPTTARTTDTEAQDALTNGVTLIGYAANTNAVMLERSITTHSQDTLGNPDRRCVDTNEPDSLYDYAKDLRAAIPQTYLSPDGQVKIAKDREPGDADNPAGVVEERDVKSTIANRTLGFWVPKGVIDGAAFEASLADGTLIVEINASDPTQCDIFIPAKVFKIAAKFGLYIAKAA
jgi:phage tail sheath gpL-like